MSSVAVCADLSGDVWPKPVATAAPETLRKSRREIIPHHLSALHHELHALHLADVAQRIAADGDDVGVLALLEAAHAVRPAVVEDVRGGEKRRLERLRRRHAPL